MKGVAEFPGWERWQSEAADSGDKACWISSAGSDAVWDVFLGGTPLGQFQQSSAWARVKGLEGWRATRFVVTSRGVVAGGFQVLWKEKKGVRFGYVSKGPVVPDRSGLRVADAVALLQRATRHLRLAALIVQPPDFGDDLVVPLQQAGFQENRIEAVYSATVLVDLKRPLAEVERAFSKNVGRQIRKLEESDISVRFGDARDAGLFFALMLNSCARQGVRPNPSHVESVRAMVAETVACGGGGAGPLGRFVFAESGGRALAGALLFRFGNRVSLWKKGVAADAGNLQPNRLLDRAAIRWGHETGCEYYDNVAIERNVAAALLAGHPRAAVAMKSSDEYKLNFGGRPCLLPEAQVWIPSPAIRFAYRVFLKFSRRPAAAFPLRAVATGE